MNPLVIFIGMIISLLLGGVLLWFSGRFAGKRAQYMVQPPSSGVGDKIPQLEHAIETMRRQMGETEGRLAQAETERSQARSDLGKAAAALESAEGEMSKATSELDRLKETNAQLAARGDALEKENEELKTSRAKPNLPPPPPPVMPRPVARNDAPVVATEALDDAQAQLDIERIAHQRTRDEVEKLKALMLAGANMPDGGKRKGAGFQTLAISSRNESVSVTEHDRLRQAYDQLQREKEDLTTQVELTQKKLGDVEGS